MILGFLGKGGSGKSSVSTQMALWLQQNVDKVLAIDADHNMDLSFNLAGEQEVDFEYLSGSMSDLLAHIGVSEDTSYADVFLASEKTGFNLSPISSVIEKYSEELSNGIRLMTAGPQTDAVLYGKACSHVLTTPLKVLLPLLSLNESEVVVVDEKAGADGVSTGIITGIDVGIIVTEPAVHGVKTAQQIAGLMAFYSTPYILVGNKIVDEKDRGYIQYAFGDEEVHFLPACDSIKKDPFNAVHEFSGVLEKIYNRAKELNKNDRIDRTVKKFERNSKFKESLTK